MNSSTAGRGRVVVAAGAIILIAACFLQWWQMGGGPGLPELKDIGISDGRVLLIFLAATASQKPGPRSGGIGKASGC